MPKYEIDETELELMYLSGKSTKEIAEKFGCGRSNIQRIVTKLGLKAPPRRLTPDHKEKLSKAKIGLRGEETNRWLGDKANPAHYRNTGRKFAHRVIAESLLKRPLLSSENVHHIDQNKANNCQSNLLIIDIADHTRLHQLVKSLVWLDQKAWLDTNGINYIYLGDL